MKYPREWTEWEMLPEAFLEAQIAEYEPGGEEASEHYRNGAFHYWLKREPSKEVLLKLAKLSYLDPEPLMGDWLRKEYISKAKNADKEVLSLLKNGI